VPVDYPPHCALVQSIGEAKLRKVNSFNGGSIGRKNSKGTLLSFGHGGFVGITHWLPSVGVVVSCPLVGVLQPSLSSAISHVVGLSSKKKMFRVDAFFVVALVADIQRFIKWSVSYLIGCPMSRNSPLVTNTHDAISGRHKATYPNPALVSFTNLTEKPIYKCLCNHEYINTNKLKECQ